MTEQVLFLRKRVSFESSFLLKIARRRFPWPPPLKQAGVRLFTAGPLPYNCRGVREGSETAARHARRGFFLLGFIRFSATLISQICLLTTLTAGGLPEARPETVGMSAERLDRLDDVIRSAIADGQTPGAVAIVARHGKTVYRKAFGKRSLVPVVEPMTLDTIFDLASMTKVMATAPAIMALVEEGRISLTDPVSRHLPDFGVNGKESITLLQLLTHFSGLRPDIDLDEPWEGYENGVARGFAEKLESVPGERFVYSDINYFVLGELVRKVSGFGLDEFGRRRFYQPLGMADTGFNPGPELLSRVAPTEWHDGTMLRGRVHDPTARRMGGVAGHAGLFASADDTALFAQTILDGGTRGETRILSPLAVFQMTRNQSPPGQADWRGIGFDIRSRFSSNRGDLFPVGSFGHTGFTGTSVWIDPGSETIVILLTNRVHPNGGGNVVALRKKVATVAAAAILDIPWRPNDQWNDH